MIRRARYTSRTIFLAFLNEATNGSSSLKTCKKDSLLFSSCDYAMKIIVRVRANGAENAECAYAVCVCDAKELKQAGG